MLLDWFDSREAAAAGTRLADHFRPGDQSGAAEHRKTVVRRDHRSELKKAIQKVVEETRPLKLNVFKRARLLNSFKWKLLEHGYDPGTADDLTQQLLLQLCAGQTNATPAAAGAAVVLPGKGRSSRRIPSLLGEADACFDQAEYARAVELLEEVLAIDPKHALAHNKLGATLCQLGRFPEAELEFRSAIQCSARFADAYLNLGVLLRGKGDFQGAETALRGAVKLAPKSTNAQVALGNVLVNESRPGDARSCIERALRLNPRHAGALYTLGGLASIAGRFEEAESCYRRALESDPRCAAAWAAISGIRRMTPADHGWRESVERLLESGVDPMEETRLRFALGKYFDDLGEFSKAFAQFRRANELNKLIAVPYDRGARTALIEDMVRLYTRERLSHPLDGASDSRRPVFVVGMLRSGTSLVEQIIASHPRAAGAGELDFWRETVHRHTDILRRETPDAARATKLAEDYLRVLARGSKDAERVVDKACLNVDVLGLIHSVFPRARFIYVQRNPIDTCLSCYFQQFANAASYTMDLSDLAHFYRGCHRLMTHWRSVLPAGTLLDVPYEELVADQESWTRRIIEFVGLEWDARCLDFHKTERPVLTASHWQVRQRIYNGSIERWRHYRKFIGPLLELGKLSP